MARHTAGDTREVAYKVMGTRGQSRGWRWLCRAGLLGIVALVGTVIGAGNAAARSLPPPAPNTAPGRIIHTSIITSDPFVMPTRRIDYLYASSSGAASGYRIPEWAFHHLTALGTPEEAMPIVPSWVQPRTALWGPDVRKVGNHYVMWFAAEWAGHMLPTGALIKCLGVATATGPLGPFSSTATEPAVCQQSSFGSIDPRTFVAPDGKEWLLWKSDDNAGKVAHQRTKLWAQQLGPSGEAVVGQPSMLMENTMPWEGQIVEAPQMVHSGGIYYLFFAGNSSHMEQNGIGLGTCKGPAGPCVSNYRGPWLGSNLQGAGPGEESLFTQHGNTWLLYTPNSLYYGYAVPHVAVARVVFAGRSTLPYIGRMAGAPIGL